MIYVRGMALALGLAASERRASDWKKTKSFNEGVR